VHDPRDKYIAGKKSLIPSFHIAMGSIWWLLYVAGSWEWRCM